MLCKRLVTHIFTLKGLTSYQLDRTELIGLEGIESFVWRYPKTSALTTWRQPTNLLKSNFVENDT